LQLAVFDYLQDQLNISLLLFAAHLPCTKWHDGDWRSWNYSRGRANEACGPR